ncbi:MAG: PilN domain-containing protein [Dehalococcoidia bacterium]|nr:PilN domain-containing protein [Dehalococcoidia bacterium]
MKTYITINLNKAESAETRKERIREQTRWAVFGILILFLLAMNVRVWMISRGYDRVIDQKRTEIEELAEQIKKLRSRGKNLSKNDIMSFADLEQDRFLWARNMELLGTMTPDDMAIIGMRFKRDKLTIKGIALTFEDRKDFEIIDEYVQTLRDNKEFSDNFIRIKYVGHQKVDIRGQQIIRFEIIASIRKGGAGQYS